MKFIKKGNEPESLKYHRSQPNASYDNYNDKDTLRKHLLKEQGYICCYCMESISIKKDENLREKMKIEHWKPQSKFKAYELDYRNLLGACLGNEGYPKHLQHCDTRKGEEIITINPINESCDKLIKLSTSGEVYSDDQAINIELNNILNLNMGVLAKNRKITLTFAIKEFSRMHSGNWTKDIIEREIEKWSPRSGVFKPYCQIVIYYFKKKLSKY